MLRSRDERRAELALEDAQTELERMLQTMVDGVVRVNADGEVTYSNSAAEKILRKRTARKAGLQYDPPDWHRIRPDGSPVTNAEMPIVRALHHGSEVEGMLHGIVDGNGTTTWLSVNAAPLTDHVGNRYGAVASFRDVTDLCRAQDDSRTLTAVVENSKRFIGVAESDGRVVFVNHAGRALVGLSENRPLSGLYIEDFVPQEDRRALCYEVLPEILEKGVFDAEGALRDFRGGSPIEVRIHAFAIRSRRNGFSANIAVIIEDIRPQRRLERELERNRQKLHQIRKLETVGRLAGGVAHKFNNLMTSVIGYSELSLAHPDLPADVAENIEAVLECGQQAAGLTEQLLAFGRQQTLRPRTIELNEMLRALVPALERTAGELVSIELIPGTRFFYVHVDPDRLTSVITHLAANAREAMPDGGKLSIALSLDTPEAPHELPLVDYVRLTVRDTGSGMDEFTKSRIFEPFFTTESSAEIKGMGLASAYGIIKKSGGYIWADSEVGKGTTFRIYLPLLEQ